jgi:proteasome alpha subunit
MNDEPRLFETDTSGAFTVFFFFSLGLGKRDVEKLLEEKYEDNLSREKAIKLALISLNTVAEGKVEADNIDMITIESGKNYLPVKVEEISAAITKLGTELDTGKEDKE